jgi:predicted negative regulator of RcsB-dependent stress response
MWREVPTWLAVVIIVIVLAIVGFAYWHFGRPKAPKEEQQLPATHQPAPQPTIPTSP